MLIIKYSHEMKLTWYIRHHIKRCIEFFYGKEKKRKERKKSKFCKQKQPEVFLLIFFMLLCEKKNWVIFFSSRLPICIYRYRTKIVLNYTILEDQLQETLKTRSIFTKYGLKCLYLFFSFVLWLKKKNKLSLRTYYYV